MSSSYTPLSINGFFEQKEDEFESVVSHICELRPNHRLLLEFKYKALSRRQLEDMTADEISMFLSKKYADSIIAEQYGFRSPQSVRTERHRALKLLRASIPQSLQ